MSNDSPDWKGQTDVAPVHLGELVLPAAASVVSAPFSLPGAATGIVLVLWPAGAKGVFSASGGVSGAQYGSITGVTSAGELVVFPAVSDWDNPVTVRASYGAALSGTQATTVLSVFAVLGAGFTSVLASVAQPLLVSVTNGLSATVSGDVSVDPGTTPISVAQVATTAALGDAGVLQVNSFNAGIPANGTANLVPAVAGQTLRIYGYDCTIDMHAAGAAGYYAVALEDTTGNNLWARGQMRLETVAGLNVAKLGPLWIPGGLALPVGLGARAACPSSNGGTLDLAGTVWFTQH